MRSLYDILEVGTDATDEELRRNYKLLSYKYKCESRDEMLIQINGAVRILSDPYQRSFYDMFGDAAVSTLLKPEDGYAFPRLFSRANLWCLFVYATGILLNATGWFYMYRAFDRYVFINAFFIISPAFLLLIHANLLLTLRRPCPYVARFRFWGTQLVCAALEVLAISLFLDGALSPGFAISAVLSFEILTIIYFISREHAVLREALHEFAFRIGKAILIPLFCIPGFPFRMFVLALLLLLFSVLIVFTLFIVEVPVLLYLLAARLLCDRPSPGWIAHAIFIPYNVLAVLSVFCVIRMYRHIPKPGSFLDQRVLLALHSSEQSCV